MQMPCQIHGCVERVVGVAVVEESGCMGVSRDGAEVIDSQRKGKKAERKCLNE